MKEFGRRSAIIIHDLFMVACAWALAYTLRFNFSIPGGDWSVLAQSLLVVLAVQGLVLWHTGLYRGLWRFASIPDLWNILRASAIGALAVTLILFMTMRLQGIPRSSLVLYPLLLVFLLGAPRAMYRVWKDHGVNFHGAAGRKRVLIMGAGRAGEMLAREVRRDGDYQPVGFLDDNKRLKGAKLQGIPVLGTIDDLAKIAETHDIETVVIAMPSATNKQMQRIVESIEQIGLPFRTLPRMQDVLAGRAGMNELREVMIEDLLGRDPVSLDWRQIAAGLAGKTVLVSGAGGSIGAELCRQIARLGPKSLVVLERSEFNLYSIEMELCGTYPNLVLEPLLGDVTDKAAVEHAFEIYRPDVIFHAAAYKHVPMLQDQPREAVRNNIIGTKIMAQAADKYRCATFVMISTDKAVNPTNIMGASKRVAELFCQALGRKSETRFITVRFGNVLGSAGSVVPLFQKQITAGGPVTVTHPDITRYFMTIPEACQLIMQAGVMGRGGEIFVLEMGQPVKIRYLAEQMIRLSGKVPDKDVEIIYTGLRPGEKLYEELFYAQEQLSKTDHDKILLAQSTSIDWNRLNQLVGELERACESYDEVAQRLLLKELVPEMSEPGEEMMADKLQGMIKDNVISLSKYNS